MHLDIARERAEVHMKSSYRQGGRYFALKIASTFPGNLGRGISAGNGMMLLSSAETGEPVAFLADAGHLTDVRTAAVAAMLAKELGRHDRAIGILGTGIQARLSAVMHAELLGAESIVLWGRSRDQAERCAREIGGLLPRLSVDVVDAPANVASAARLIVTCTASREPLLRVRDVASGTHISAIGSDSPGKQELDPALLERADLLLADSRRQCERLGELQHAPELWDRAVEIGAFCEAPHPLEVGAITIADFTGLGVEDLYIAEYVYEKVSARA
jgi:ornithine cyclodeaminase